MPWHEAVSQNGAQIENVRSEILNGNGDYHLKKKRMKTMQGKWFVYADEEGRHRVQRVQ